MYLPQKVRAVARKVKRLITWELGRYKSRTTRACSVCLHPVKDFKPISAVYADTVKGHGYELFGDGETINADDYTCPWCGATDRSRLMSLYLDYVMARAGDKPLDTLHFAPDAALRRVLSASPKLSYVTADLAMPGVDVHLDITDMNCFSDESFDLFICSHVLEHIVDDAKAIRELHRILRPGGEGLVLVPLPKSLDKTVEYDESLDEAGRTRKYGQADHVRLYARNDFIERLQHNGFAVRALGSDFFGVPTLVRHGLVATSTLYVVRRQPVDA